MGEGADQSAAGQPGIRGARPHRRRQTMLRASDGKRGVCPQTDCRFGWFRTGVTGHPAGTG